MRVLAVVAVLVLAGCTHVDEPPATTFDGEAALAFVKAITRQGEADLPRVPGTPEHAYAAGILYAALQQPGWDVRYENFTGADYQGLAKGEAEAYTKAPYCKEADRARVVGLTFSNLVADRPGPSGSGTLILAAHWDSKRYASNDEDPAKRQHPVVGANDGASGVGVILQLQRSLPADLPFGLRILFVDGEDGFEDCHPLAGSLWHATHLGPGKWRVLLLDMVGDPEAKFVRETRSQSCDPAFMNALWQHGQKQNSSVQFLERGSSVVDDHVPFAERGIPAVDLIDAGHPRAFPWYWHTTHDTFDQLSSATLRVVGQAILDTVQDPSFVETWPARCG